MPEGADTSVLANEIKHLNVGLGEVKDEVKGLRQDFSDYLDKEAERWQKWSEVHSAVTQMQARQNEIIAKQNDHELRIRRLEYWGISAIGALTVITFVLNYLK